MELTDRSVVQTLTSVQDPREQAVQPGIEDDDYPETEATIRAALIACNAERAELGIPPVVEPTYRERRMHADLELIYQLMTRWGTEQVVRWTKTAAAERGYRGGL